MQLSNKHILIIVENLPVPFDTRVWQEAICLTEAGATVSIVCPAMKGFMKKYECIEGIKIYRYPLFYEASNALGYLGEYVSAFFFQLIYAWKIFLKKRFHVIHGCNPPDLIFIVALFFKVFGVKYVFDHHDIAPELYQAKFGRKDIFYSLVRVFERMSFKTANYSIATNDSYKEIAIRRGKMDPSKVHVVRSGPSLERIKLMPVNNFYKKGRVYLVGYVGVIGKQEGLDLLLDSIDFIVKQRTDIHFAIIGGGTELEAIRNLAEKKCLQEYIDFYGRVPDQKLIEILSSSDICVNPDEPTEMNNLSTMNKIMEYMALKKPIVQYDLKEGRVSAQEASLYAENYNTIDFAQKIIYLLENEEVRIRMGQYGYERILKELAWNHQKNKLIKLYNDMLVQKI